MHEASLCESRRAAAALQEERRDIVSKQKRKRVGKEKE